MFSVRNFGLRKSHLAVLALLLAFPLAAVAQITTATIVGTITDPSGAILPGAQVTARNADTGLTRTVTTNESGSYRLEFLPVGNYALEVTANGLKKATQTGIVLQVNDTARVDVSLTVGSVNEAVTITEAVPAINTSTAEIGRTIQSAEITNLPLVERNVYALLDLTPGVQSNNNGIASASTGTNSLILGFPEQRTLINGGTDGGTGSVNYYLDGGSNMTNLRNTGNVPPNPDAVQEFRVQTNSVSAEFGRFGGGVVNLTSKSGTNAFHGSGYEFLRNKVLNANTFFNNRSAIDRPSFTQNQYGANVGGPVLRDRTFFFFNMEKYRDRESLYAGTSTVPNSPYLSGNLSNNLAVTGNRNLGTDFAGRNPSCTDL